MGKQSRLKNQRKSERIRNQRKSKKILLNKQKDVESKRFAELSAKGIILSKEILEEQGFPNHSSFIDYKELLNGISTNFFSELYGLNKVVGTTPGTFNFARKKIFNAVCWLLLLNPSPELCEKGNSLINEAASEMYKADGNRGMEDPLLWLFFPKSWHRVIDNAFHGAGEWLS